MGGKAVRKANPEEWPSPAFSLRDMLEHASRDPSFPVDLNNFGAFGRYSQDIQGGHWEKLIEAIEEDQYHAMK